MYKSVSNKLHLPTRAAAAFALLFLIALAVAAQTTGSLKGTVTDSTGAVVPMATVELTPVAGGSKLTTVSNNAGEFAFTGITPGTYRISVTMSGFTTKTSEVTINLNQTTAYNITVDAAGVQDVIAVSGTADDRDNSIPNYNNDLSTILEYRLGAVPSQQSLLGKAYINGRLEEAVVRLDGLDASLQIDVPSVNSAVNVLGSFLKPAVAFNGDKDGELTIPFSARNGPGGGAYFNNLGLTPSKEYWTGQLLLVHDNDAVNARNYFEYFGKNGLRRTRFAGRFGGPLDKAKRLRLFFAYEGQRGRIEQSVFEAIPNEAFCRCGVSGVPGTLLANYLPGGTVVRPGVSLNPNYSVAERRNLTQVNSNAYNARFEYDISGEWGLLVRFTPQLAEIVTPDGITGRVDRQNVTFGNFIASLQQVKGKYGGFYRFGINATRSRSKIENPNGLSPELLRATVNLSDTVNTAGLTNTTSVPVAVIGGLTTSSGRGYDLDPKAYSLGYDGSYGLEPEAGKDRSKLRFGAEFRLIDLSIDRLGGTTYAFSGINALRSGNPTTVNYLSDLSGASPFSDLTGKRRIGQRYFSAYIERTQNRGNLTLVYGLRYDYFGQVRERDDRVFMLDPKTGVALNRESGFFRANRLNFQPRGALVYVLPSGESDKFAGFGRLFTDMTISVSAGVYSAAPRTGDLLLPVLSDRLNTTVTGGSFATTMSEVLTTFRNEPLNRLFQPLVFDRDFSIPERVYHWSATLTKKVLTDYELRFTYLGNAGRNLPLGVLGNPIVGVATNPDPTQPAIVTRQFDVSQGQTLLKPYGEFFYRAAEGKSDYQGFKVAFGNRANLDGRRLNAISISYLYGVSKGNVNGEVLSRPLDTTADYGYTLADARHTLTLSPTFNLWEMFAEPNKKGSFWLGWRLRPKVIVRSGLPLQVRISRPDVVYRDAVGNFHSGPAAGRTAVMNVPGGGAAGGTMAPDINPLVNPFRQIDGLRLINPAAFTAPLPGTFGNYRQGSLRGPASVTFDLSVTRYLYEGENNKIEFKADFFNVLNKTNYRLPTASLPNRIGTDAASNQIQPGQPYGTLSSGTFGIVTGAEPSRQIQFSVVFKLNKLPF